MKRLSLVYFFAVIWMSAISQAPSWVNHAQRSSMYPAGTWLVSFRSESCDEDEAEEVMQKIVKMAKSDLVEQIRVTVKSSSTLRVENVNARTDEFFRQEGQMSAEATLTGLKTETWYDRKKKEAYAIAVLNKPELEAASVARFMEERGKVEQKIKLAEELGMADNIEDALRAYGDCMPILRQMENSSLILTSLGISGEASGIPELEARVRQGMAELRNKRPLNLNEAALFIAEELRQQVRIKDIGGFMFMGDFTFSGTRQETPLSGRLAATLEQKMTSLHFNIKEEQSAREALREGSPEVYQLSGTYWDEGELIRILTHLRRVSDGKNIASSEAFLSKAWVEANSIRWMP